MTFTTEQYAERDALLARGLKCCSHCREVKPVSAFPKDGQCFTGYHSWCKLCMKSRRIANSWQIAEYNRNYLQEHREKVNACIRRYRKTDKGRRARNRRRALSAELPATLTIEQWQICLDFFDNRCAYCGASGVPLAQEHVVPLSADGGYVAANVVPACGRCNSSKNNTPLEEWVADRGAVLVQDGAVENIRAYLAAQE